MGSFAESSTPRPSGSPQPTRAAARLLVDACVAALCRRSLVTIVDQKGEGTLMAAAGDATPAGVTEMLTHGRGIISVCLTPTRCRELRLFRRGGDDPRAHAQPYVTSVDAAYGVTTGISAADRATTIRTAADPRCGPGSLREPGHVFVLRARKRGLSDRAGHTEASIELARRGGSLPAAVICEILDDKGALAPVKYQVDLCERLGIPLIHVADLTAVLPAAPAAIVEDASVELCGSEWRAVRLQEPESSMRPEHLALVRGDPAASPPALGVVLSKPLARLLGQEERGAELAALSDESAVLIALGAKRQLADAVRDVTQPGMTDQDARAVVAILQALRVRSVRRPAGIRAAELERHGIRVLDDDHERG
jgi:3,4-dihydroxy-2-butanone 4-phosphate synthase